MLAAIVFGFLLVCSALVFTVALRASRRPHGGAAGRGAGSAAGAAGAADRHVPALHLDRLEVGAEVHHDKQRWVAVGVQHVRPADGPAWSAWHLDDLGQSGWMSITGDEVVFAVRAEKPETVDPEASPLVWRDVAWTPLDGGGGPADVAGDRRVRRGPLAPLSTADVERVVFSRAELPSRRLVVERVVGEPEWNVWIGGVVPAWMLDVWPPVTTGSPDDSTGDAGAAETQAPGAARRAAEPGGAAQPS